MCKYLKRQYNYNYVILVRNLPLKTTWVVNTSCPYARQLSVHVPVDEDFLRDKAVLFGHEIKGTLHTKMDFIICVSPLSSALCLKTICPLPCAAEC